MMGMGESDRLLRIIGGVWMLLFLIWLPFEDTQIWMSAVLGTAAVVWLARRLGVGLRSAGWPRTLITGAALGLLVPLMTIALMAFKSGLHGHGFADFSARQLVDVLYAMPAVVVAGILLAVSAKILLFSLKT
jgi:hypothetical protein